MNALPMARAMVAIVMVAMMRATALVEAEAIEVALVMVNLLVH